MKKAKTNKKNWGFDIKNIDKSVRPQDDFYHYANGNWLKKNKIPPEESRWGSFLILRYKTEQQLKVLIEKLLKEKRHSAGSREQLVADLYRSAMDMPRRNTLGVKPLEAWLEKLHAISTKERLIEFTAELHRIGVGPFWNDGVGIDAKNSAIYRFHFAQGGLGMPDRDYYLLDTPEQKRVREAYVAHMRRLLRLAGKTDKESRNMARIVMDIETRLARASMRKEELREPEKIYHKYSVAQLTKLAPSIDWRRYLEITGVRKLDALIVMQPGFFAEVGKLYNDIPLRDLQAYVEWHISADLGGLLSEPFVKENFKWAQTLTGQKKMRPLWRRALGMVNSSLDEALGKLYIEAYFDHRSKKIIDDMVTDLFSVYRKRIAKLDWMSAGTKRHALKKLAAIRRKIGYPKKFEAYRGLDIVPTDYFGNMLKVAEFEHIKDIRRLPKPVDRNEWQMPPQMVNAYYEPQVNEIVFPAAILQPPFFGSQLDMAVNYGCIGAVIGHEMTHGFDDEGSQFDAQGNLKSWWSAVDRKRFTKKAALLVEQYNEYAIAPGVHINGKLTLGENIADLGGLTIAYEAFQHRLEKTGRTVVDGFSPEERFYFGFAQFEQELVRPEFTKLQALTDPHAASFARINGPLANFEPFYETFNLKKGDKLHRDPKKRAKIW